MTKDGIDPNGRWMDKLTVQLLDCFTKLACLWNCVDYRVLSVFVCVSNQTGRHIESSLDQIRVSQMRWDNSLQSLFG